MRKSQVFEADLRNALLRGAGEINQGRQARGDHLRPRRVFAGSRDVIQPAGRPVEVPLPRLGQRLEYVIDDVAALRPGISVTESTRLEVHPLLGLVHGL